MANFLNKLSEMAKTAADKTGDMIEIGKLNAKISSEEDGITDLKGKIGHFYWEKYLSTKTADAQILEWCEAIQAAQERIEATRTEIQLLKEQKPINSAPIALQDATSKCPACGTENGVGTKFCSQCGNKL